MLRCSKFQMENHFRGSIYVVWIVIFSFARADFQLYDYFDYSTLSIIWNLTDSCISALNSTVACDQATSTMLGSGVDYNYWYMDNITTLCTTDCLNSLTNWSESVEQACQGQTVLQSGVIVEAKALSLSFTHNADIACLQDSQDNWCFFESQTWQGSDYIRYDPAMCWNDEDNPTICDDPDFDISSLTEDMMAITNLYNTSLFCSECFLELYRQRLLDPWLTAIQLNCSTSMPYTTSSATLYVGPQTVMPTTVTVTTDITVAPTPTCLGQVVQPISNWLTCNDLCDQYNVSTGDARLATGDPDCYFDSPICLPPPCYIQPVWNSPSCESLAKLASNTTYNVSETQFLSWNGNILGSCDGVANGQRICLQAPGGTYPSPSVTIVAPTGTAYYTTATPAYPTQSGTITDCGLYYQVGTSDDCSTVDLRFGITFSQLKKLNTYLDDSCSNLWLNYDICVAEVVQPAISTDGSCGLGVTCIGSTFGSCCSPTGQCTNDCGSPGNSTVSTDGSCGPNNGFRTCPGSGFGDCCSIYGYCGNSTQFCGAGNCYSGACATDNGGPSTTGECGPLFAGNKTCTGTQFGNCCSTSGYCGSSSAYCDPPNCYSGACTTSGYPSTNGLCGPLWPNNMICPGSQFGDCCSTSGYCGSTVDYCSGINCYSGACTS